MHQQFEFDFNVNVDADHPASKVKVQWRSSDADDNIRKSAVTILAEMERNEFEEQLSFLRDRNIGIRFKKD